MGKAKETMIRCVRVFPVGTAVVIVAAGLTSFEGATYAGGTQGVVVEWPIGSWPDGVPSYSTCVLWAGATVPETVRTAEIDPVTP